MNDFTKEELISLQYAFYSNTKDETPELLEVSPLLKKLERMIDNYCEHEYENHCCGCELQNIVCNKCDRCLA